MLRNLRHALGPFILDRRVTPDWWQSFHREERHRTARARIIKVRDPNERSANDGHVRPISYAEANDLVRICTRNHNAEDLGFLVQYIRETLDEPLVPLHYHALFRVFNYTRDKENVEHLFTVLTDRGEVDMLVYARIVDALHCLAPTDALARILRVIALVETSCGTLVTAQDEDSDSGGRAGALWSPLLTSLLHHVASSGDLPPTAAVLVALWMRALGAELCDWDYVHLLAALLARPQDFPRLRSTVGVVAGAARGTASPRAVLAQLEARGELAPASAPLSLLAAAMRASLQRGGGGPEAEAFAAPVALAAVNAHAAGLPALVDAVAEELSAAAAAGRMRGDALHCGHTLALLHSTLRNDTAAVGTLTRIALEVTRQSSGSDHEQGNEVAPHHHYLMDIGSLLQRVSVATTQAVRSEFAQLAQSARSDVSQKDVAAAESYAVVFARSNDEAYEALRQATESIDLSDHRTRLPTKLLFRRCVELCARHPRPNCKMTAAGLEERRKWGRYLDARDTSLALFGSAKQARDSMKHLFYNDNRMPELRSPAMVERDLCDMAEFFAWRRPPTGAELRARTSVPHLRCAKEDVPQHLWDPLVPNPYPHVMLQISPMDDEGITDDIFQEVWRVLMNPAISGTEQWYLRDAEMYLLLMRCLIHRLDWEAAAQLTLKTMENLTYTYMMDHEVTLMFREIGDPMGCLAFKVATKLFDGRILKDGQSKREKFHQEQFGEI